MEEEVDALRKNLTWDLVPKHKDVKPILCKWVYKVKTRAYGRQRDTKLDCWLEGLLNSVA